jgi:hypothetical protein
MARKRWTRSGIGGKEVGSKAFIQITHQDARHVLSTSQLPCAAREGQL